MRSASTSSSSVKRWRSVIGLPHRAGSRQGVADAADAAAAWRAPALRARSAPRGSRRPSDSASRAARASPEARGSMGLSSPLTKVKCPGTSFISWWARP